MTLFTNVNINIIIFRYTKLGYAGNTEPQFIIPSCEYTFVIGWVVVRTPKTTMLPSRSLFYCRKVNFDHKWRRFCILSGQTFSLPVLKFLKIEIGTHTYVMSKLNCIISSFFFSFFLNQQVEKV